MAHTADRTVHNAIDEYCTAQQYRRRVFGLRTERRTHERRVRTCGLALSLECLCRLWRWAAGTDAHTQVRGFCTPALGSSGLYHVLSNKGGESGVGTGQHQWTGRTRCCGSAADLTPALQTAVDTCEIWPVHAKCIWWVRLRRHAHMHRNYNKLWESDLMPARAFTCVRSNLAKSTYIYMLSRACHGSAHIVLSFALFRCVHDAQCGQCNAHAQPPPSSSVGPRGSLTSRT
ncbi:hypothetical protein KP509_38G001500 [Ceratopteris richardii]|uniref:Uncharacterized protein n=1 Tax=Ceratopteris richardii TaxID=49495 RepID=A0A8T2Q1C7_CERRI|nr:hypothetical protein KP509_38G001500 [Ceratopteris richardii]